MTKDTPYGIFFLSILMIYSKANHWIAVMPLLKNKLMDDEIIFFYFELFL